MRKLFCLILLVSISIIFISCSKDDSKGKKIVINPVDYPHSSLVLFEGIVSSSSANNYRGYIFTQCKYRMENGLLGNINVVFQEDLAVSLSVGDAIYFTIVSVSSTSYNGDPSTTNLGVFYNHNLSEVFSPNPTDEKNLRRIGRW